MFQRIFLAGVFASFALAATAQDTQFPAVRQQIPAPDCMNLHSGSDGLPTLCGPSMHDRWLRDIQHWRTERRVRIAYDGSRYAMPELQWTQSSFMQPQMMVHDRYFYDPVTGKYTVDRYLDDLEKRYGGIDAVLIWATYPNMGVDDRNQLDMISSMPGGLDGVKQMVADFHHRGVKVLFPMMMWDLGTNDPLKSWPQAIADEMKTIGADGVNGDTQDGIPLGFVTAAEKIDHPLAFEPEQTGDDEEVAWNVMTWGQYNFPFVPMVDRFKWIEPRHMVNISHRWAQSKTNDLQYAFFNGVGWESWENVWGIWNGITPRDAEATRRVATIEREVAPFLVSADWEPHYPMQSYGVYASRWPEGNQTVWTIVNRNDYEIDGRQMRVSAPPGTHYFDLYHGVELIPDRVGGEDLLRFSIEANGFGAILARPGPIDADLNKFLARMKAMSQQPLDSYSDEWKVLPQTMVEIAATAPAKEPPPGMVRIAGGQFDFKVHGVEIEGGDSNGVDVQYPWEDSPRRWHEKKLDMKPYFIDKYPVTNAEFKEFLDATHYTPQDSRNFLRDWKNGQFPAGWEKRPVTWVSLEDARAYAKWAGKRLPHEWEWQFAAQGMDERAYPWGNAMQSNVTPEAQTGRTMQGPDPVDAHPQGASPYRVMDMVGNVWQWTDEYDDEHTRAAIVRGGEYYSPQGSKWYFPNAQRNDEHGKFLLMSPSMDRSGGIGFRCVRDAE